MRIVLTLVAAKPLLLPWLADGALLLVYIGVSPLLPEGEDEGGGHAQGNLLTAIRTIMIADLVMSLDNVVAVAAAAMGDTTLLVLAWPSAFRWSSSAARCCSRSSSASRSSFAGAALLGFIAGELLVGDPALQEPVARIDSALGVTQHSFELMAGVLGRCWCWPSAKSCWLGGKLTES